MKVIRGACCANETRPPPQRARPRGRDRGKADEQADSRRHGESSDGRDGTGQPSGCGRCRKMGSRRGAKAQRSLPLAPDVRDRLEQSALRRGAVFAGIAGQVRLGQFSAALDQRSTERREIDAAPGPCQVCSLRISLQALRYHDRPSLLRGCGVLYSLGRARRTGVGASPCQRNIGCVRQEVHSRNLPTPLCSKNA